MSGAHSGQSATPASGIAILPAGDMHVPACERLWTEALPAMFAVMPKSGFAAQTEGEEIFVALAEGEVSMFVSVWRPQPFIHFLVVDPALRRTGVGTALLDHAVNRFGVPIDLKCEVRNRAACAFYEARGWRQVERVDAGGAPYILYRLDPR